VTERKNKGLKALPLEGYTGGTEALPRSGTAFFWFAPLPPFPFEGQEFTLLYLKRTLEGGTNTLISLKKMTGIAIEMEVRL